MTIQATNGDDTVQITGTSVEEIKFLGGNDTVFGGRGADRLSGNDGNDTMIG
ncbi:MAG: calcium-binding protein, partial [Cyanobacteria bacterium RM1_2_2]|nr:calcium-binding protein [Cyanobacteria bacterium RM1_2_2]